MRRWTLTLAATTLLGLGACATDEPVPEEPPRLTRETEACICGTRAADLDGCPCHACVELGGNPDNPDCVCGPIGDRG